MYDIGIVAYLVCTDPDCPIALHPGLKLGTVYANCSLGFCKYLGMPVTSYNEDE